MNINVKYTPPPPRALYTPDYQEIAPSPLDVYVEGASAWLGVLLHNPAYGPDEVEDKATRRWW